VEGGGGRRRLDRISYQGTNLLAGNLIIVELQLSHNRFPMAVA
jgi:hypothetical protein